MPGKLNHLLAAAVRVAMGAPAPPPPPKADGDRVRIEAVEPGDPREPAPGKFNAIGDVAYVRAAEFEAVKRNLEAGRRRAKAKRDFGNRHT